MRQQDLLVQWAWGYPSLEHLQYLRARILEQPLDFEVRDHVERLFVWLAAGTFLPIAAIVVAGSGGSVGGGEGVKGAGD